MKKMDAKYKKIMKIATLMITSIIIASVSAAELTELYMYGSGITITDERVSLVAGTDTPLLSSAGVQNDGTTVTFDTIDIAKGALLTYNEAVKIQNTAGVAKDVVINVESLTGPFSNNFDYIYITMYDGVTQKGAQIQIVSSGTNVTTTGTVSMPDTAVWTVQWIIKAKTSATTSQAIDMTVKITAQ